MYRTATALLEALQEAGVSYVFANFGSDHPPILESVAEARAGGRQIPKIITCPHEMVALTAAHGFAQVTGHAQAVLVHVDVGTQMLAGALHNACRARVPALILSGASPYTQEGELRGSRNEFIHWLQDVFDQRGIVRGYVKYDNEVRSGRNIKQIVHRALQIAHSDPPGPVYLMAAREVLEEEVPAVVVDPAAWPRVAPAAMAQNQIEALVQELLSASRPLIVTSYLGRNPAAVEELICLAQRVGAGVVEAVPNYMNFPADHPLYLGNQGNEQHQNPVLQDADFVLVLDSDIPWMPTVNKPRADARIYHIDIDPLKEGIPLWYIGARNVIRADSTVALRQINQYLDAVRIDNEMVEKRRAHYRALHEARAAELARREQAQTDVITPEYLTACVRKSLDGDVLILNEAITNSKVLHDHLRVNQPGSLFTSGASSLGWNGGAALGMKLARPEKTVVALSGDGSYMFSAPSTVHWMARRYETPFLQIVYNNRGWRAPKLSMLALHPQGRASAAENLDVTFNPPPDYAGIAAAAGGALAQTVREPAQLEAALKEAFRVVREEKRCAVLDVWLPHL